MPFLFSLLGRKSTWGHRGKIIKQNSLRNKRIYAGHEEIRASQVAPVVKNASANAGDARDMGLIPGSGTSSGVGNGSPPQYSCPENSVDRGAWRAAVHGSQRIGHN